MKFDLKHKSPLGRTTCVVQNENKIELEPHGPHTHIHTQTQQQYTVAPATDSNDKASLTGVGLRDFDIIGCIPHGITDDNELEYDISCGMFILCFVLV